MASPSQLSSTSSPMFDTLVVVGVGLIGGSVAAAAKTRKLARRVVGLGRSAAKLRGAVERGILDEAVEDPAQIGDADLVVACTPVDRIADDIRRLARILPADCLYTDAGSVKEPICRSLVDDPPVSGIFVGGHPLAGSEKGGWEHSDRELFHGKLCVVTPTGREPSGAIARTEEFWKGLGMQVRQMSPQDHDTALALTSHLPHLVASALAAQLTEEMRPFAARGFRDTTRIAAGDPDLWTSIFSSNTEPLQDHLKRLMATLSQFATALDRNDATSLRDLLTVGQTARQAIDGGD